MVVAFVEKKVPDLQRVATLLERSASVNRWANRGPLYNELAIAIAEHAKVGDGGAMVPLANGGVALEVMARFFSLRAGKQLRWIASAFSFRNLGRGYFHNVKFLDCDEEGLLDLDACARLDPDSFDGLIVTNPFGLHLDFTKFTSFARTLGKVMLIDNASGFHTDLPDWPWQAFSFHHTKPYGVGEGGAALVPREHASTIYSLVDYAPNLDGSPHWLGNGKISDLSCAFILERLERSRVWSVGYVQQRDRMIELASRIGFIPMSKPQTAVPLTSIPFLSRKRVSHEGIKNSRHMTLGKYYKPLCSLPRVNSLYARLVNVPCHPDVGGLKDAQIIEELDNLTDRSHSRPAFSNQSVEAK